MEFKMNKEDYRIALKHLTESRKKMGWKKAEQIWMAAEASRLDHENGLNESMSAEANKMRLDVIEEVYSETETVKA